MKYFGELNSNSPSILLGARLPSLEPNSKLLMKAYPPKLRDPELTQLPFIDRSAHENAVEGDRCNTLK
jgi:hypothetical protein